MRIMIYTDPHWSEFSSIVRSRGDKYTTRLENLIKSINWVEQLAVLENCDAIFVLGDFFDKSSLTAEEITALREIQPSGIDHVFLCGNHEISRGTNEYSSAHLFSVWPNCRVIDTPANYDLENEATEVCFIPYISSTMDKSSIEDYIPNKELSKPCDRRIIFSHNDISGIQYGSIVSKGGFDLQDIEDHCDLFINGHLHNGGMISKKIINVGNLTGQNFGEDAQTYMHAACILNTETLELSYYENPYALNFYKYEVESLKQFEGFLSIIKPNAVLSIKSPETLRADVAELLAREPKVVDQRITLDISKQHVDADDTTISELVATDHIKAFSEFIHKVYGHSDLIEEELSEILKQAEG